MHWSELDPDLEFIAALDEADRLGVRRKALNSTDQQARKTWSNRFADSCARMVARRVAAHPQFANSEVRPNETTNAEPITFLIGGKAKRVDVVVSSISVGLQLGISLKGMNFRDAKGLQFDKNLTGRTYELEDEVRVVHRTLPMAFMAALYFLPLASTKDKSDSSASSFARTVEHLRARVGRSDPHSVGQSGRLDAAAIALYVAGDDEAIPSQPGKGSTTFRYRDELTRGVIRYFDVTCNPPRRGRPPVDKTLNLSDLVSMLATKYRVFTEGETIEWSEPEADD